MTFSATRPLLGNRVLVAVTGSIAACRADEINRHLQAAGAQVRFLLTEAGARFFPEATAGGLTQAPVLTDQTAWEDTGNMAHIEAKQWADLILVAPATANRLLNLPSPQPNDLLGTVLHAFSGPVLYAPAMNQDMWNQSNVQQVVRDHPDRIIEPLPGTMACGETGTGRLADPSTIVEAVVERSWPSPLAGQRWLVSAGGTREPWDEVRVLTNHSTGRMGAWMALVAQRLGAEVELVTSSLPQRVPLDYVKVTRFSRAEGLEEILTRRVEDLNGYVSAAAVADYRPKQQSGKVRSNSSPTLELEPVPDLLQNLNQENPELRTIGFAVEPSPEDSRAGNKLKDKELDCLVVNYLDDDGGPFGNTAPQMEVLRPDRPRRKLPRRDKAELALEIWSTVHE